MILVTGANGFVGQYLIPEIIAAFPRQKIVCLVVKPRKTHEKTGLKKLKQLKVLIIQIDLLDRNSLKKIPKSPSQIVHLAASVDTSESDFRANDIGTKNLYYAINPISTKTKFIYISTAAVWTGRKKYLNPLTEADEPVPNNLYGRTKLEAERFLVSQSVQIGFELIILRLNTVYGADSREDKLFGVMKNYVIKKSILSQLNWPGKFGIVHVTDVVKTIVTLLQSPVNSKGKEKVFLVSTENITLQEISQLMHRYMDKKYSGMVFPQFVWQIGKFTLQKLTLAEKILPNFLFNYIWRANLAVNDVLMAEPKKVKRLSPRWKRQLFKDHVEEVVNA